MSNAITEFLNKIQDSSIWKYDDVDNSVQVWDKKYHSLGDPVPANASMFGLTIIDWDKSFRKRLKTTNVKELQIPFQYIEQIPQWEKSANWNDSSDIIGRFEPMVAYSNSAAQEFQINLIYHAEAEKNSSATRTHWTLENIDKYTRKLQSLVYPMYNGQMSPPPKLKLNIGSIYIDIPIIIKQVQYTPETPFDIKNLSPHMRKISLQVRLSYPTWQGIGMTSIYTAKDNKVFAYKELKV